MTEKVEIRGIEILAIKNKNEFVHFLMNEKEIKTGKLVAVNAEKVVAAEKQSEVRSLLQAAEYKYADGISIVFSIRKKFPRFTDLERIAGADLWEALMQEAGKLGVPVFLVGGEEQTVMEVKNKLVPWKVDVVGIQNGYFSLKEEEAIVERIKLSGAKLITVAMGTPKQEQFMQRAQQQYPEALYMGVGGTYDVFTGRVKRAPKSWQNMHLEWLYRLLSQPTRWRRQLNLIRYFYYYLTNKL